MDDFVSSVLNAELGKTHLFSVGQAGFIVKSASGQLLGIDLYLSDCVERLEGHVGFKRLLPRLFDPADMEFDVLIATHAHWDHFDVDAMPILLSGKKTRLLAAGDCKSLVEQLELDVGCIRCIKPGDSMQCGDFFIHFIRCDHGEGAPEAVGAIIEVDGTRICEVGETCLHLDWKEDYLATGPLDVLMAPINGAYGNMSEADCARLSAVLAPRLIIPCHYGMFASHGGNPGVFLEEMKKSAPGRKYLLMAQGERLELVSPEFFRRETT